MLRRDPEQPWHPSYWLASLGAGGLSVSFFMYLMWLVPHPGFPMPTWQHLETVLNGQASFSTGVRAIALLATLLMLLLAALHFVLLIWNFREHRAARSTESYSKLPESSLLGTGRAGAPVCCAVSHFHAAAGRYAAGFSRNAAQRLPQSPP
jgi:hypothetical protein